MQIEVGMDTFNIDLGHQFVVHKTGTDIAQKYRQLNEWDRNNRDAFTHMDPVLFIILLDGHCLPHLISSFTGHGWSFWWSFW